MARENGSGSRENHTIFGRPIKIRGFSEIEEGEEPSIRFGNLGTFSIPAKMMRDESGGYSLRAILDPSPSPESEIPVTRARLATANDHGSLLR